MRRWTAWGFAIAAIGVVSLPAFLFARHAVNQAAVEKHWQERPTTTLSDFGHVERLKVTVLVGPKAPDGSGLVTEPGLALRLDIDGEVWLYDLGLSGRGGRDALRSNAKALVLDLADIDAVFLSHRHRDHIGGAAAEKRGRLDLDGIGGNDLRIVAPPASLTMPERSVTEIHQPAVLGEGFASLGPIRRALFIGLVEEQALLVDVRDYGLVAVVGCGHQTVPKLSRRVKEVFGKPLRAVVGDLHYPVPEGRLWVAGIDAQRRLASGEGPLAPVDAGDVIAFQEWASSQNVELYLVGHDTHDAVLSLPEVQPFQVGRSVNFGRGI